MKQIKLSLWAVSSIFSTQIMALDTKLSCDETVAKAESLNAFKLWRGAEACFHDEKKPDKAMFLLITGQMRAKVDLAVLKPKDNRDKKVTELSWLLFYMFGGAGADETYRNTDSRDKLFNALKAWNPNKNNGYNPGWEYANKITQSHYQKVINCEKKQRITTLQWHTRLIQDDEYYALRQAYLKLKKENKGIFKEGTEDEKHQHALSLKMNTIMRKFPMPVVNFAQCLSVSD